MALAEALVRKGDRTRTAILERAVSRFAAGGYRHTSVSEIARDVGVSPAAVYAYFAGKSELFAAAVDADAAALIDEARAGMPATDDVGERWLGLVVALVDGLDQHPLTRRVLAGQEPEVVGRLVRLPTIEVVIGELADDLAAAQARGRLRADVDPAVLACGTVNLWLVLVMAELQLGDAIDDERHLAVLSVFEAAMRPPA